MLNNLKIVEKQQLWVDKENVFYASLLLTGGMRTPQYRLLKTMEGFSSDISAPELTKLLDLVENFKAEPSPLQDSANQEFSEPPTVDRVWNEVKQRYNAIEGVVASYQNAID